MKFALPLLLLMCSCSNEPPAIVDAEKRKTSTITEPSKVETTPAEQKLIGKWCNHHGSQNTDDDYVVELHQINKNTFEMKAPIISLTDNLTKIGDKYMDTDNLIGEFYRYWGDGHMGAFDEDGLIYIMPLLPIDYTSGKCKLSHKNN